MRLRLTAIVTVLIVLLSVWVSVAQSPDPRSTVEGTIDALTKHLRARQFSEVVRDFEAPDDSKKPRTNTSLQQIVVSRTAKGDFDRLLAACEHVSKLKPQMFQAGTLAIFEYVEADGKKATFGLRRVANRWYLL